MPVHKIRRATIRDTRELARLCTALGHATAMEAVTTRWDDWAAAGNTALVADNADGTLAGVATLHQMVVLHRPKPNATYFVEQLSSIVL